MMKKKRSYYLSLLALVLILCAFVQPAWAYFTCNNEADGAVKISFGRETTITEEFDGLTKKVTIWNKSNNLDVWIRARAYASYPLDIQEGDGWSNGGDGWYYYLPDPVAPGGKTAPLTVSVTFPTVPDEEVDFTTVNVGVVYESTTAFYNADGVTFEAAEWDYILDTNLTAPYVS